MSGGQPAEEVAEDYKASLEYLTNNDRYAINNFTVIAKENTENADAISNVLIEHIGKARPDHKLPALYVLDSIAKNIGTPYNLFLGHKLYGTFMDAYSKVDRPTRKKLDEMLKTWKSPVPGSIDSRPVFPIDITKKIENALIQAKTRAIQYEQEQQRAQMELLQRRAPATTTPTTQWRNTPTPPQNTGHYPAPVSQGYLPAMNGQTHNGLNTQYPQFHAQQPPLSTPQYQQIPQLGNVYPSHQPNPMLDTLHRDVEGLIQDAKQELLRDLGDASVRGRLNALLQLQQALRQQQLRPDQFQAVRDQVRALQIQAAQRPLPPAPMPVSVQTPTPAVPMPQSVNFPTPSQTPYAPPLPTTVPPSTNLLANLLASVERNKQAQNNNTYQIPAQAPTPQPRVQPSPVANGNENPLIAQLRASGLLSGSGTPSHTSLPPAPQRHTSHVPQPQVATTPGSLNLFDLLRVASMPKQNGIEFTPASLKTPRPHLIFNLYDAQPRQCLTCGKRFPDTDDGRNKKARHLDWHFRTNQRIADSAQRGQSRSWYVDELEWIRFREDDDEGAGGSSVGGKDARALAADAAKNDPKNKFIPAPSDSALASMPCAICQEKFEMSWKEELQDFVWMDAIKIGGRVYHASCYADYKKDEDNAPARMATPDSVLGKRKAEIESGNPAPAKMLRGTTN